MSDLTNVFTNIADAIRAKTETQITYKPTEMANAINNISSGGGALVYNANGVTVTNWFNFPVTIAEGVTDTSNMFKNCHNFNQLVTIPNSVTSTASMFAYCFNFNQPIVIPNSVTSITLMFSGCNNFNQPIVIPNSVTSMSSTFYNCYNFNQPIVIPNNVVSTFGMLSGCNNFNQSIVIPNSVAHADNMFYNCYNFNQPIVIPNNVVSTFGMLSGCKSFNQPITLEEGVTNTVNMFFSCHNFNQPVTIPNNVTNTVSMFLNCSSFNQPVIISNNVTNMQNMFNNCTFFGSNIYVYRSSALPRTGTANMLRNCDNQSQKHIFTNYAYVFNGTSASQSVTGTAITWTQDGNNYYNTTYNIYIHNVANPYTVLNNADYSSGNGGVDLANINSPAIVFGSGVQNLSWAFEGVQIPADTVIFLGNNITKMRGCFSSQQYLNQPMTIPSSVQSASEAIRECNNFNSPIIIRNGVKDISKLLFSSVNFDRDIWIPESVDYMDAMLADTAFESGTGVIHISHNIALGNTDNYIYNSLVNGSIEITLDPSRILNDY